MFLAVRVALIAVVLTCVAAFAAKVEFGSQQLSIFTLALAYVSSWPSLFLGVDPALLFRHLVPTLFVNATVWGGSLGYRRLFGHEHAMQSKPSNRAIELTTSGRYILLSISLDLYPVAMRLLARGSSSCSR